MSPKTYARHCRLEPGKYYVRHKRVHQVPLRPSRVAEFLENCKLWRSKTCDIDEGQSLCDNALDFACRLVIGAAAGIAPGNEGGGSGDRAYEPVDGEVREVDVAEGHRSEGGGPVGELTCGGEHGFVVLELLVCGSSL